MSGRFQSHGYQTSVDTARQQTTTIAGLKRPHQNTVSKEPVTSVATSMTTAAANATTVRQSNDSKRRPVDFIRASAATHEIRIAASPIRSLNHSVSAIPPLAPPPPAPSQSTASNPLLSLQHPKYGLPPALVANFQAVGIDSIYPWQASCLLGRGHLTAEKNLLYTAPTGGGKSLVADVLMLKRVIENPFRKAILVLPYVALVQEKLKWLRRIVQDVEKNVDTSAAAKPRWKQPSKEIRVTGFFGGSKSRATWADTDIAICTIEKVGLPICRVSVSSFSFFGVGKCSGQYGHRGM
jgi:hypothetical protein